MAERSVIEIEREIICFSFNTKQLNLLRQYDFTAVP